MFQFSLGDSSLPSDQPDEGIVLSDGKRYKEADLQEFVKKLNLALAAFTDVLNNRIAGAAVPEYKAYCVAGKYGYTVKRFVPSCDDKKNGQLTSIGKPIGVSLAKVEEHFQKNYGIPYKKLTDIAEEVGSIARNGIYNVIDEAEKFLKKKNLAKAEKPKATKPKAEKPKTTKPKAEKPKATKPKTEKPKVEAKPKTEKPNVRVVVPSKLQEVVKQSPNIIIDRPDIPKPAPPAAPSSGKMTEAEARSELNSIKEMLQKALESKTKNAA